MTYFGDTALERAILTVMYIERLPENARKSLFEAKTEREFWDCWEWAMQLPSPETAKSADEYIQIVDPTYWSDSELSEVLP